MARREPITIDNFVIDAIMWGNWTTTSLSHTPHWLLIQSFTSFVYWSNIPTCNKFVFSLKYVFRAPLMNTNKKGGHRARFFATRWQREILVDKAQCQSNYTQTREENKCLICDICVIECLMVFKFYQTRPNTIERHQTRWPTVKYLVTKQCFVFFLFCFFITRTFLLLDTYYPTFLTFYLQQ